MGDELLTCAPGKQPCPVACQSSIIKPPCAARSSYEAWQQLRAASRVPYKLDLATSSRLLNTASVHWCRCDESGEQATKAESWRSAAANTNALRSPAARCPANRTAIEARLQLVWGHPVRRIAEALRSKRIEAGAPLFLELEKWTKKCGQNARVGQNPKQTQANPKAVLASDWSSGRRPKIIPQPCFLLRNSPTNIRSRRLGPLPSRVAVQQNAHRGTPLAPLGLRAQRMEEDCTT